MAALMTSDYDDTDRSSDRNSNECKHMGIIWSVPPDVNESFVEFGGSAARQSDSVWSDGTLRMSGAGGGGRRYLRAREIDNGFESLEDFLHKVSPRIVNRKGYGKSHQSRCLRSL